MTALATSLRIAREMITADLLIKTGLRLCIGAGVLAASTWLPPPVSSWMWFAGSVFLMFALYQAIGHAEGRFMAHAVSWLRARRTRRAERRALNRARTSQLAYCRRCGCGACPHEPSQERAA